eukprot:scpid101514/ scgid10902/ 
MLFEQKRIFSLLSRCTGLKNSAFTIYGAQALNHFLLSKMRMTVTRLQAVVFHRAMSPVLTLRAVMTTTSSLAQQLLLMSTTPPPVEALAVVVVLLLLVAVEGEAVVVL